LITDEEAKLKLIDEEDKAKQLEQYLKSKAEQSYLEAVHSHNNAQKQAKDDVSSDHDSHGKLKPSHQPFKQKGVTFKSDG